MKDNELLIIILAFFLGTYYCRMMDGGLIEGSEVIHYGDPLTQYDGECVPVNEEGGEKTLAVDLMRVRNQCNSKITNNQEYETCRKGNYYQYNGESYGVQQQDYTCMPNVKITKYLPMGNIELCEGDYNYSDAVEVRTETVQKPRTPLNCQPDPSLWDIYYNDVKKCDPIQHRTETTEYKLCKAVEQPRFPEHYISMVKNQP